MVAKMTQAEIDGLATCYESTTHEDRVRRGEQIHERRSDGSCACGRYKRRTDYPRGRSDGMSFICNRWVFTGSEGYRVQRDDDDGTFRVVSYNAAGTKPVYGGSGLTEDDAHAMAARLAK